MGSKAKRVALLARPGAAGQRLADVLGEADIDLVLQADPTQVEAAVVLGAHPDTLLVALDTPTEDALDRLEPALRAPNIDVIYEEADLVVAREGWDAARWRRHLLAKLQGHDNVLPPAQIGGAPTTPVSSATSLAPPESIAAIGTPPGSIGEGVAAAGAAAQPRIGQAEREAEPAFTTFTLHQTFDVVPEPVLSPTPAAPVEVPAEPARPTFSSSMSWSLEPGPADVAGDADAAPGVDPAPGIHSDVAATATHSDHSAFADIDVDEVAPVAIPHAIDAVFQAPAPPEGPGDVQAAPIDPVLSVFDPVAAEMSDTAIPPAMGERWAEQAFLSDPQAADTAPEDRFSNDLASLELRIASMSLVDDTPVRGPEKVRGAVLVLAGIGGPDAVRQLLGSLPTDFVRPVLVQQRLDGARYDRLVAQMQRATTLPVRLADAGQPVEQGAVYIIPDNVGVTDGGSGLVFQEGDNDILAVLPAADSAVLMLSGTDVSRVDAALSFGWNGGLVIGQNIDGCYDAAAVTDLTARGGTVAKPAEMGPRLAAHWQRRG